MAPNPTRTKRRGDEEKDCAVRFSQVEATTEPN